MVLAAWGWLSLAAWDGCSSYWYEALRTRGALSAVVVRSAFGRCESGARGTALQLKPQFRVTARSLGQRLFRKACCRSAGVLWVAVLGHSLPIPLLECCSLEALDVVVLQCGGPVTSSQILACWHHSVCCWLMQFSLCAQDSPASSDGRISSASVQGSHLSQPHFSGPDERFDTWDRLVSGIAPER